MNLANLQSKIPQHSLHIYKNIQHTYAKWTREQLVFYCKNNLFSQLVARIVLVFLHWKIFKKINFIPTRLFAIQNWGKQFNALALSKWLCEAFPYIFFHSYFVVFFFYCFVFCVVKRKARHPRLLDIFVSIFVGN